MLQYLKCVQTNRNCGELKLQGTWKVNPINRHRLRQNWFESEQCLFLVINVLLHLAGLSGLQHFSQVYREACRQHIVLIVHRWVNLSETHDWSKLGKEPDSMDELPDDHESIVVRCTNTTNSIEFEPKQYNSSGIWLHYDCPFIYSAQYTSKCDASSLSAALHDRNFLGRATWRSWLWPAWGILSCEKCHKLKLRVH